MTAQVSQHINPRLPPCQIEWKSISSTDIRYVVTPDCFPSIVTTMSFPGLEQAHFDGGYCLGPFCSNIDLVGAKSLLFHILN